MDTVRRETDIANLVPAPVGNAGKLYSEAVRAEGRREKRYQLIITSRTNHSGDAIKNIIKTNVNPTSMKVGIRALKSLRDGRVIILTVIRRQHRVVESLQPTEFPFKSLRVFDRKRLYLVNRR